MASKTAQPITNTIITSNLIPTDSTNLIQKAQQLNNNDDSIIHKKTTPTVSNGTSLLGRVLQYRQLLYADQLFTVSDYDIITELHSALIRIKNIFNDPTYTKNSNDQSVVELILSRLTAAIRETSCIETYAPALVDVLDACLLHRMYIIGAHNQLQDSPHCKIVSELLSTLFLYHSKKSVMTVAIPVAIKALSNANQDLVRNTTSYLSLAAIHNGRILAQYSIQIISNIINGNYSLVRVLPQVYPENREPFHAHLSPLFRLLHYSATDISEKLSLLQLASMITNTKPELIIPHLSEFDEFLMSDITCTAVLHIILSIISKNRVDALVGQLLPLRRAFRHSPTQNNLATMAKIVGVIGRSTKDAKIAEIVVQDLVNLCHKSNSQNLPILLKEIEGVAEVYPESVKNHMDTIKDLSNHPSTTYSAYMRIRGLSGEDENRRRSRIELLNENTGTDFLSALNLPISVIADKEKLISGFIDGSSESDSISKHSLHYFPNDPTPNTYSNIAPFKKNSKLPFSNSSESPTIVVNENNNNNNNNSSIGELDRNMKTLADSYKMRSSGSLALTNPKSKSFLSLTNSNNQHSQILDFGLSVNNNNNNNNNNNGVGLGNEILHEEEPSIHPPIHSKAASPQTYSSNIDTAENSCFTKNLSSNNLKSGLAQVLTLNEEKSDDNKYPSTSDYQLDAKDISQLATQIQIGKDGRVRPISNHYFRHNNRGNVASNNFQAWLPLVNSTSSASQQQQAQIPSLYEETTTTFPVNASGSVIKTTTTKSGSCLLGGSCSSNTTPKIYSRNEEDRQKVVSTPVQPELQMEEPQTTTTADWKENMERDDVVKQFVENRRTKIRRYVAQITLNYPIPARCTVEGAGGMKNRIRVHFSCQITDSHCIFNDFQNFFAFKTKIPAIWLHLMFLEVEAKSIETHGKVLSQESDEFQALKRCWECLPKEVTRNRPFVMLVTSAFPSIKEQSQILKELQDSHYFDSFICNAQANKWTCFSCAHPEKVKSLLKINDTGAPLLEGQLKEKRGRWKLFKRWHTKYFTLSSAALTSSDETIGSNSAISKMINPSIELRKIRSVKSLSRGRRSRKSLPKAFEVFMENEVSYVLKANDRKQAEEWFQCLQIAIAAAKNLT